MSFKRLLGGVGVVLMAAFMAACGNSSGGSSSSSSSNLPPAAVTISVDVSGSTGKYSPAVATARVGDVVEWDFTDDVNSPHTVTSDDGTTFDSQSGSSKVAGNKGDKFQFTFTKAGTYKYHCTFHADMVATITVA